MTNEVLVVVVGVVVVPRFTRFSNHNEALLLRWLATNISLSLGIVVVVVANAAVHSTNLFVPCVLLKMCAATL